MDENVTNGWFDPLFRTEAMRRVFSDRGRLQGMLDFEAALAHGLAAADMIPPAAAEVIAGKCRAELFDVAELARATALTGSAAIPVAQELERLVGRQSEEAARYVHFGATSQDANDTGLMLQVRDALDVVAGDFEYLCIALAGLANQHKQTPMAGRTWLQHAAPITLGLKIAGWLSALARHQKRLGQLRSDGLVLQLGGAVGTLAAYGDQANRIATLVAAELQLCVPDLPWHAHRDRFAEIATVLGLVTGTLGKIARDVSLLSQSEIGELAEPRAPGRGTSSSMPHKQNPVGCAVVLAVATRVPPLVGTMLAAMPQEHERGLGGWQAEWETLPEIFELTAGALAQMRHVIAGLVVDTDRMQANLEATGGLDYAEAVSAALAPQMGRAAAHAIVGRACRRAVEQSRSLQSILGEDAEIAPLLSAGDWQRVFDRQPHIEAAARLVDRSLNVSAPNRRPPAADS